MLITDFKSHSSFNSFWNDSISNLHGSKRLDLQLYILWRFNRIDVIKAYIENDVSISNYVEPYFISNKEEYNQFVSHYNYFYSEKEFYIYPYSSTKFINHMFKNILPSAKDNLFDILFNNSLFIKEKFEPSAAGFKGCIVSKYLPDDAALATIHKAVFDPNTFDSVGSAKQIIECLDNLTKDNEAYRAYVSELETAVLHLNKQIDLQQKEGLNGYLLNWH